MRDTTLNIIALENWPSTQHGGQPFSTFDVLRGLAARGHRVTLLYTRDGDLLPRYRAFCAEVVPVQAYLPFVKRPMTLVRFVADVARGARRLRLGGNNLVYSNNFRDAPYVLALGALARMRGLIHLRVPPTHVTRLLRFTLAGVRRFVSVSNDTKAIWTDPTFYASLRPERLRVVHNGIDTAKYSPAPPSDAMLARCGIGPGDVPVTYVGRVDRVKGIDVLIRAMAAVRRAEPGARLIVAGKGHQSGDEYVRELQALAAEVGVADAVRFIGHTTDTADLFRASAVSVLPSTWPEPFGRTIPESMACGTPAVASRTGGIPEILTGEFARFLAEPNDPASLATAITRAIAARRDDRDLPERMRGHVLAHFDVARTVENVERVMLELCGLDQPSRATAATVEPVRVVPVESGGPTAARRESLQPAGPGGGSR